VSEWRQFRILVRVSLGRLADAAVASRDTDAAHFVIWIFALVTTPPLFYAMRMMGKYSFMWRRPDLLERAAVADRLFFIIYAMLASGLLAAMLWDALFPDRRDQEIVGVLPVRPRTLAAARLTAAIGVALVFSAGIALPSGLVYMANVGTAFRSAAIIGWAPAVFIAHIVAVTGAGLFSFAVLVALRALAVVVVGAEGARRAAVLLQFVTILLLVETLIFLPGVLYGLINQLDLAAPAALRLPPLWFVSLYASLGGPPLAQAPMLAAMAVATTAGLLLLAYGAYVFPARWHARRTLEVQMKARAGRSMALLLRILSLALRAPAARAVFAFTLASLTRSRRHALKLATYLGAAGAVAAVRLMSAGIRDRPLAIDAPADYLLALPMILTFMLVAGLISAFSVPTDIDGNWAFRVAQPRSVHLCAHALGVALLLLGVFPVALLWALTTAWLWPWPSAAGAVAMHVTSSVALVQIALVRCRSIPFTRAYIPATRTVRGDWVFGVIALHAFGFLLAEVQDAAIVSMAGVMMYVGAAVGVAAGARAYRLRRRHAPALEFDAPIEGAPASLNLSQAVG
jgi:hypothetical protein